MMQVRFLLAVQGTPTPLGLLTYSIVSPGTCRDPPSSTGLLCCMALCSGLSKFRSQPAAVLLGRPSAPGIKARVFPGVVVRETIATICLCSCCDGEREWATLESCLGLPATWKIRDYFKFNFYQRNTVCIILQAKWTARPPMTKSWALLHLSPHPESHSSEAAIHSEISFHMFMDINRLTVISWFLKYLYILY